MSINNLTLKEASFLYTWEHCKTVWSADWGLAENFCKYDAYEKILAFIWCYVEKANFVIPTDDDEQNILDLVLDCCDNLANFNLDIIWNFVCSGSYTSTRSSAFQTLINEYSDNNYGKPLPINIYFLHLKEYCSCNIPFGLPIEPYYRVFKKKEEWESEWTPISIAYGNWSGGLGSDYFEENYRDYIATDDTLVNITHYGIKQTPYEYDTNVHPHTVNFDYPCLLYYFQVYRRVGGLYQFILYKEDKYKGLPIDGFTYLPTYKWRGWLS